MVLLTDCYTVFLSWVVLFRRTHATPRIDVKRSPSNVYDRRSRHHFVECLMSGKKGFLNPLVLHKRKIKNVMSKTKQTTKFVTSRWKILTVNKRFNWRIFMFMVTPEFNVKVLYLFTSEVHYTWLSKGRSFLILFVRGNVKFVQQINFYV